MRKIEFFKPAIYLILLVLSGGSPLAAELLMVEQHNCPYCEKFHAQIGPAYPNTDEGQRAPLRIIMIDDPMPEELAHIEPAFVTPTFILLENNEEIDRLVGYPGDEHFWFLLNEMLEKLGT